MKVLYFFASGFDKPHPSIHLMSAMIQDTLKSGINVHMILSNNSGADYKISDEWKHHPNLTFDVVDKRHIENNKFEKRYLNGIKYAWDCIKVLKKTEAVDAIYVQSCPTVVFNIMVARLFGKGAPIIYSVQDMFPGSAIYSGVMPRKWMQKFFFSLQKVAYRTADHIRVISDDMKEKVIEQGVSPNKITTIVNWYNDQSVHEVEWSQNRFVKKHQLKKNKFYVQYAGTMGFVFDYQMVIKVANLLKDYRNIEFQMIGQGSQKDLFLQETKKQDLKNIVFYDLEPQHMVSDVYSACSVCLIPLKKGVIGNSVPSKAGLLMACNRTIVNSVDPESNYFKIFNEHDIGISVSNENPEEVAKAILDLYHNPEKRLRMAQNGRDYGKELYSRKLNTEKLIELFKQTSALNKRTRKIHETESYDNSYEDNFQPIFKKRTRSQ